MMDKFGVPLSAKKMEGPCTVLSFLSIEIDSVHIIFVTLATKGINHSEHQIQLTKTLKADLCIWREFLQSYNGQTCCQELEVSSEELALRDAAGSVGFSAILGTKWCIDNWPSTWWVVSFCRNLVLLELFPIVVAVKISGEVLRDKRVCFWSDNLIVVHCISCLTSSSHLVLALLLHLVLMCFSITSGFELVMCPV